jgi:PAS domain S-box-containing protein
MNLEAIPLWLALVTQLGLGLAVYRANHRNHANQAFLVVSCFISAWLLSLQFAFNASDAGEAELWIRNASASGVLMLNGFNLLRLGIVCREGGWPEIGRRSIGLAIPSVLAIAFCYTRQFLQYAEPQSGQAARQMIPHAVYGPLAHLYGAFLVAVVLFVTALYMRSLRGSVGMRRVELQFVLFGGAALIIATIAAVLLQPIVSRALLVRMSPFRVVMFTLIIAYGIATRKMMEVGFFFRRLMSYAVLAAYLLALYGVVWWLLLGAFRPVFGPGVASFAHVTAAIAVAFAMAPARGVSQSLADRLFVGTRQLDFASTMNKAANILKSVTTIDDLLERFASTTAEAVGSERVVIFLLRRHSYVQCYATSEEGTGLQLEPGDPVIQYLSAHPEPLVFEELHRVRATPELQLVISHMEKLHAAAIIGIFSRHHLAGVMLLGPRVSGRIYGNVEQNALQLLGGQLAVAIENAELFTEVQNAKIYNETLLQNLTTGVIAADADCQVTVFNKQAEQITGLRPERVCDQSIETLPPSLQEVLRETLRTGLLQDRELVLESEDESIVVRASSSVFHGQHGESLGALMVLTDVTALKRLEQQIRRSDRLASLGTLSAGMAHEIKNPLVSIKTFAQLLPERYQDSDFRDTFSSLIGHEIDRIDSLVNQLLRFARPAKPHLKPMHVHDVLEKSLLLVGHRLYQKDIKLTRRWEANVDTIRADADQLEQVFLNFFINAMDAMKKGGELTVTTAITTADPWAEPLNGQNGDAHEILRISIEDNGEGIRAEDVSHVFDPFFTTKDYGTGLGLSVVHGIVQEHGGQIEVESEMSKGTAFHIMLPLVRFSREVAAA